METRVTRLHAFIDILDTLYQGFPMTPSLA
jgi:hypothetical protein